MEKRIRIIFVCHGNICRSPAAEFIFKKIIKEKGLDNFFLISSKALTNEEIGNDIYPPMKKELIRRGVPFIRHYASKINQNDYEEADYIFYMDESNRRIISYLLNDHKHIIYPIHKFTSFDEIEDPWYTNRFSLVCDEIESSLAALLENMLLNNIEGIETK